MKRQHPDLRLVSARNEAFTEAMRTGFSFADARDYAQAAARLEARRLGKELPR